MARRLPWWSSSHPAKLLWVRLVAALAGRPVGAWCGVGGTSARLVEKVAVAGSVVRQQGLTCTTFGSTCGEREIHRDLFHLAGVPRWSAQLKRV